MAMSHGQTRAQGVQALRYALRGRGDPAIEVNFHGPVFIAGREHAICRPKTTSVDSGWVWAEGLPKSYEDFYLLIDVRRSDDVWIVPSEFARGGVQGRHQQWHAANPRSRRLDEQMRVLDHWTVEPYRNAWHLLGLPEKPTGATSVEALADLEVGKRYRRADLHAAGLGGDRYKGISYPATGDHVLLFSGGTHEGEYGYSDRWLEEGRLFLYYGEWSGTDRMLPRGGNAAITDRSPQLYLFRYAEGLYRFEGQFESLGYEPVEITEGPRVGSAVAYRLARYG